MKNYIFNQLNLLRLFFFVVVIYAASGQLIFASTELDVPANIKDRWSEIGWSGMATTSWVTRDEATGALIRWIADDGPAAGAGLRVGDLITAVDEKPLGHDSLPADRWPAGEQHVLTILRGSDTLRKGFSRVNLLDAVKQGNAAAIDRVGQLYENDSVIPRDYSAALVWYKRAADQGFTEANVQIGYMYQFGNGVKQDDSAAMQWMMSAAEKGNAVGQRQVGLIYEKGLGVKPDFELAAKWFRMAADNGDSAGQNNLGNLYFSGKGVSKDYQVALDWYKKAAAQGNTVAQNSLGGMYENGYGVERDADKALDWYELAAERGNENARRNVSRIRNKADHAKLDEKYKVHTGEAYTGSLIPSQKPSISFGIPVRVDQPWDALDDQEKAAWRKFVDIPDINIVPPFPKPNIKALLKKFVFPKEAAGADVDYRRRFDMQFIVHVDETGRITHVDIVNSGRRDIKEFTDNEKVVAYTVVNAFESTLFSPAKLNDQPVASAFPYSVALEFNRPQ